MGACEGECMGHSPGDEPLTLTSGLPQLYEALEWTSCPWQSLQLKSIKSQIFLFFSFTVAHFMA